MPARASISIPLLLLSTACAHRPASAGAAAVVDADTSAQAVPSDLSDDSSAAPSEVPSDAELDELARRHAADLHDLELALALFDGYLARERYEPAWDVLEATLYVLAQAHALPPEATWLGYLESELAPADRVAQRVRCTSILRKYYIDSLDVRAALVEAVIDSGDVDTSRVLLDEALLEFPGEARLLALRERLAG